MNTANPSAGAPLGSLDSDVLIVVDLLVDFCPGGSLPVPGGDEIVPVVNRLTAAFPHVILIQDWHPANQVSFASTHGLAPFSTIAVSYGEQVLWPDHAVAGTPGADFHPGIRDSVVLRAEIILRKGYNPRVDSYSAFYENDHRTSTGLAGFMRERGYRRAAFVGLAFDYCVGFSADDAVAEGFEAAVILDATRSIDLNGSRAAMLKRLTDRGVVLLDSERILGRAA